ncbi:Pentatricopeptide repeat-containing protein At2g42920, chloroplastic [Linum grandiflorum]
MASISCSPSPPPPSITIGKFISDQPYLAMLETHCKTMRDLHQLHCQLIKTGVAKDRIAASRVLAFCTSPAGDINYAYSVFSRIKKPTLFSWNQIIKGFSYSSTPQISIALFVEMLVQSSVQPSILTFPSVFKAYTQLGSVRGGAQLHARVIKSGDEEDEFVRNSILSMYANCGFFTEARRLFDYDSIDCSNPESDPVPWNVMITALAKRGEIEEARKLFDEMPRRSVISWNSMISGYVRTAKFVEALEIFGEMQDANIKPSEFTMVSLLNACACLGAIRQGEWIHDYIVKNGFELNPIVVTSIIDMYSKCGSIDKARYVFKSAAKKSLSCWNSMILGLATNGHEQEAIDIFEKIPLSNLEPDFVSFIGVLTACNHGGFVDMAKEYFSLMRESYNIKPLIQHYSCMVDVLGRAGFLEEAEEVIKGMTDVVPDAIIWGSLLSSSEIHGNVEMAKRAATELYKLDPSGTSRFVLMSNVHASAGQLEEAIEERVVMKENQVTKVPGCSSIELDGEVHEFVAGGSLHPEAGKIYDTLDELGFILKQTE